MGLFLFQVKDGDLYINNTIFTEDINDEVWEAIERKSRVSEFDPFFGSFFILKYFVFKKTNYLLQLHTIYAIISIWENI